MPPIKNWERIDTTRYDYQWTNRVDGTHIVIMDDNVAEKTPYNVFWFDEDLNNHSLVYRGTSKREVKSHAVDWMRDNPHPVASRS